LDRKRVLKRLGFELDKEVNKSRIEPLLVIAIALIYRAVRLTDKREIVVGGRVFQTGRVDDFQVLEVWRNDVDLDISGKGSRRQVRSETYEFIIHVAFRRGSSQSREHSCFERRKTFQDVQG
jgi:hypothetical protein